MRVRGNPPGPALLGATVDAGLIEAHGALKEWDETTGEGSG